jgi:hypothetical protein
MSHTSWNLSQIRPGLSRSHVGEGTVLTVAAWPGRRDVRCGTPPGPGRPGGRRRPAAAAAPPRLDGSRLPESMIANQTHHSIMSQLWTTFLPLRSKKQRPHLRTLSKSLPQGLGWISSVTSTTVQPLQHIVRIDRPARPEIQHH